MCLPSGILFDRENASCLVDHLVPKSAGSKLFMFYIWTVDKACKVFGLMQLPDQVYISLGIPNERSLFCRLRLAIDTPSNATTQAFGLYSRTRKQSWAVSGLVVRRSLVRSYLVLRYLNKCIASFSFRSSSVEPLPPWYEPQIPMVIYTIRRWRFFTSSITCFELFGFAWPSEAKDISNG